MISNEALKITRRMWSSYPLDSDPIFRPDTVSMLHGMAMYCFEIEEWDDAEWFLYWAGIALHSVKRRAKEADEYRIRREAI